MIVHSAFARAATITLDFASEKPGTILDKNGLGTGLTYRLPSTGASLPPQDPNIELDTQNHQLILTTTNSDINYAQNLGVGEYFGVRLSDLGFTGTEDFSVTAVFKNIPTPTWAYDQFGLYAGPSAYQTTRGGFLDWGIGATFLVIANNNNDIDVDHSQMGLPASGPIEATLRRTGGRWTYLFNGVSLETKAQPDFLNGLSDLYVGIEGADAAGNTMTLYIDSFSATVNSSAVPEPATLITWSVLGGMGAIVGWRRRRKRAA